MAKITYIDEETVKKYLNWESTFDAVKIAMESVVKERAIQNPRTFTKAKANNLLLTMPGYLNDDKVGALACKLITVCPNNANTEQPVINANITLFDENSGILTAIVGGTEITKWRTAAASAVATKYLTPNKNHQVLAILGAGVQGEIHALAFQHFFKFKEVRIWNHNSAKAEALVSKLNQSGSGHIFKHFKSNEECVKDADVIVTATFTNKPIVELEWLKQGVHINAVGAGVNHHSELSESIYLTSNVYIDHFEGANVELSGLKKLGVEFKGEIGSLITGDLTPPPLHQITVFQSLGMAVEDCAMARVIYDLYKKDL